MKPFLMCGGSNGEVFIVTKYREDNKGNLIVDEKFDVTGQFNALASPAYSCNEQGRDE
jgi:hypothetical protein